MKLATGGRRLGATDAAALLGVSKYSTPADVYARIALGKTKRETAQMRRGTRMEPEVRRLYQGVTGAQMQVFVMRPLIAEHPVFGFATASPDDITVDGVLCEYKTASRWAKGWADGAIPADYVCQVLWALWVTQLERAHLFVAFGEDFKRDDGSEDFAIERTAGPFSFSRDAELEVEFAEVGGRFWREHVEKCIPPFSNAAPTAAPTNEANQ